MDNWDWPQYVAASITAVNVLLSSYLHGQPRIGKWSGPGVIIGSSFGVFILYMGGFY